MKCPYCLTAVLDEAVVCHACAREFHLFRPLMAKVAELEARELGRSAPDGRHDTGQRAQPDAILPEPVAVMLTVSRMREVLRDAATFLVLPLALLLIAHAVIVVLCQDNLVFRGVAPCLPKKSRFGSGSGSFWSRQRLW
jgi:hypothetical protein